MHKSHPSCSNLVTFKVTLIVKLQIKDKSQCLCQDMNLLEAFGHNSNQLLSLNFDIKITATVSSLYLFAWAALSELESDASL